MLVINHNINDIKAIRTAVNAIEENAEGRRAVLPPRNGAGELVVAFKEVVDL
jgi:hypothetical protein